MPFPPPGEFSQSRDQTCISLVSCLGRQIFFFFFLTIEPPGKPLNNITAAKIQRYNLASDLKCYLFVKIPIYYKPSRGRKEKQIQFSSVQFSCSVVSDSLQPCGLQQARPPCPSPTPRVYSNSCPLSQ